MKVITADQLIQEYGIDYLKTGSLFGALSDDAICALIRYGEVLTLDEDELLFEVGDAVDGFYIVVEGDIQLTKLDAQGGCHTRDVTFGNEIGYVALVSLRSRGGTARAAQKSILLKIKSLHLYEFQRHFPTDFDILLLNLARQMARRIHDSLA